MIKQPLFAAREADHDLAFAAVVAVAFAARTGLVA